MSVNRYDFRLTGKALAQDPAGLGPGVGTQLLLSDPGDYNLAILQALRVHDLERPNVRVVDQVLLAGGFRFVLSGTGALSGLVGVDAFVDGASNVSDVFLPWVAAAQGQGPLDPNTWRVMRDPGSILILELLASSGGAGETMRLVFASPHQLTEAPNTITNPSVAPVTVLAGAGAGLITNGTHSYVFTWKTLHGETAASPAAAAVNVANNAADGKITVTIPASLDPGIVGANVYRTIAGDAGSRKLVGSLVSVTGGGVFTDNLADASLGAAVAPAVNTAGGANTVLAGDADAFAVLIASLILELAAVKAVQNTGNTGLPNDVVDRRNQSDIFRSRSKELRDMYRAMIGTLAGAEGPGAASGWTDLDVPILNPVGALWHTTNRR